MNKWDGYIHINGNLQVKRMFGDKSSIDRNSPFVKRYIGIVIAADRDHAFDKLSDLDAENNPEIPENE